MRQPAPPARIEAPLGETKYEAQQRRRRYQQARRVWERLMDVRCGRCGQVRHNVVHNTEVEDQLEGPGYYDFETHDFEEPKP